jgi:hypothetical protein
MEKGRKELLKRVPTRKLLASIKKDLRHAVRASAASEESKKK